jgi:hypothetical protein
MANPKSKSKPILVQFAGNLVCLGIGDPLFADRVLVREQEIEIVIEEQGLGYRINRKTGKVQRFRRKGA